MIKLFIGLIVFLLPLGVSAADSFTVTSGTAEVDSFVFSNEPGSTQQGEIVLTNTTQEQQDVTLYMAPEGSMKLDQVPVDFLFARLRFYAADVPEDYEDTFEENDRNIDALCQKRDENVDLDAWCDGTKSAEISIGAEKEERVLYHIGFDSSAQNASAVLVARSVTQDDKTEFENTDFKYKTPVKSTILGVISQLRLTRVLGAMDFMQWWQHQFHDLYDSVIVVENHGNGDLDYTVDLIVTPASFADEYIISQTATIEPNEKKEHTFDSVVMPYFGSVQIKGQIRYISENTQENSFVTEPARIFIFPLKAVEVVGALFLLVGGIVLMVRRRARKKKNQSVLPESVVSGDVIDAPRSLNMSPKPENTEQFNKFGDIKIEETVIEEKSVPLEKGSKPQLARKYVDAPDTFSAEMRKPATPPLRVDTESQESNHFDIAWMGEDEQSFDDAMRMQERKLNLRVAVFAIVFFAVVGLIIFMIIGRDLITQEPSTRISIEDLRENINPPEEEIDDAQQDEGIDQEEEDSDDTETSTSVEASDVRVIVLNGGGTAGAAGTLSTELEEKKYDVAEASNANSTHAQTTLYFDPDDKAKAQKVAQDLASVTESPVLEESSEVAQRHGVDVVIVIGEK